MQRLLSFQRPLPIRTNGVAYQDTNDVTTTLFYPMTQAFETRGIDKVQILFWMTAPGVQVAPGMQFSNDGHTWSTATGDLGILAYYNGNLNGWATGGDSGVAVAGGGYASFPDGFEVPSDSGAGSDITAIRLYVRFGLFVRNTSGTGAHKGGTAAMEVRFKTVDNGVVAGGPVMVVSGGGSTSKFTPITEAMASEELTEVRATVHIEANAGVDLTLAFEESDDGVTWSTAVALQSSSPTTYSAIGFTYPTTFVTPSTAPTKRWVRWGVVAVNQSTGDAEFKSAVVSLKTEWR